MKLDKIDLKEVYNHLKCKPGVGFELQIRRCGDPSMWYANRVGEWIPVERLDRDGIWAREPAGYLNIIKFEDVK